jgi:GT2 family glycosyltransferase
MTDAVTELTIVIVSHNTKAELEHCLRSLQQHPPRMSHEIVVVDNASQDGSADAVRSQWPGVHVIALERNIGFAAANNRGIRATRGELILLLNSDTIVPEGAIDRLAVTLRTLPRAAVVGPQIVDGDGRRELSFGRMMSPVAELRQKALVRLGSAARIEQLTSRDREVDWVTAACLLVSRKDAEAAGLFDERYFMYCEDVDFCAAIRARGGAVYFTPSSQVVHLRGRSWRTSPTVTAAQYRRSQLAFYRKHHPGWVPLLKAYLALRGKLPAETADNKEAKGPQP